MAKKWRNKSSTVQLTGFEEIYEAFERAGKDAEVEGRKLFEHCAETIYDELYEKAEKAGLPEHLLNKIDEEFIEIENKNVWHYEVGWKKSKPKDPLPDTYKVVFYNYGTPSGNRKTKADGQRVQIDGKWVTLKNDRGQEPPHPADSHGFIKKAKLAASRKVKKLQKEALAKILGELE